MEKRLIIVMLIVISLLVTACAVNPATETPDHDKINGGSIDSPGDKDENGENGDANGGSADAQPNQPNPNALTEAEIAELQKIYSLVKTETGHRVPNFYNSAIGMAYADAREISLIWFFRQGDQEEFESTRMTDEEYAFIKSVDPDAENLDWYRISAQDVEATLQMCFGLSLSDMNNIDDLQFLHYWEETDCYYSGTTSPAPFADNLQIIKGTHLENGTISVQYTTQEGNHGTLECFTMLLKPVDGGYHILSNIQLESS